MQGCTVRALPMRQAGTKHGMGMPGNVLCSSTVSCKQHAALWVCQPGQWFRRHTRATPLSSPTPLSMHPIPAAMLSCISRQAPRPQPCLTFFFRKSVKALSWGKNTVALSFLSDRAWAMAGSASAAREGADAWGRSSAAPGERRQEGMAGWARTCGLGPCQQACDQVVVQ